MDVHLYVWARRQEVDRELVRLALVAEAAEASEEKKVSGEHAHGPGSLRDDGQAHEGDQRQ
jgi:hypothetical protein